MCSATGVPGRKIGKLEYCLNDYNNKKGNEQIEKAKFRQQLQREKGQLRPLLGSGGSVEMASRQNLINDLDFTVSRIVRLRAQDKEGMIHCYTCNFKGEYKQMQCSHFISRTCLVLRWDIKWNTRPGCVNCNCIKHGNLEVFKENLELEMPGITTTLEEQSRDITKLGNDELKTLLTALREELKLIENSRK